MYPRGHGPALICASIFSALFPGIAAAKELSPEERAEIERRLVHQVDFAAKLAIEEGDTIFIERREQIASKRIPKKPLEYEGLVTGIVSTKGVVVHPRVDEVKLEPTGDKTTVVFRYAIHVTPGVSSGSGRVQLTLALVERTGLANTILQSKVSHWVDIKPATTRGEDLAADFEGYRLYTRLARDRIDQLQKKGLKNLTLAEDARLPPLDRASIDVAAQALELDRFRRRAAAAHRHLVVARMSHDPKLAANAKAYFANLDKPEGELSGLPEIAIVPGGMKPSGRSTGTAQIETLKPERVEPAEAAAGAPKGGTAAKPGALAPLSSYEPGSEADDEPEPPQPAQPKPEAPKAAPVKPDSKTEVASAAGATARPGGVEGPRGGRTDEGAFGEGFLVERSLSRETPIPSYPRGLVLDDPNIAHGFAVRFDYARVKGVDGASGIAPAVFFSGQVAVTRALGLELTIPTEYVNLDVQRSQSIYVMGNPLVAAKYRFYLPAVGGRQPVLTVRARWAIPIQPLHTVPPTQLGAEDFSLTAHFVDTYAFMLEKSDIGGGLNAAYQAGIIYVGAQIYGDYFIPVSSAIDQSSFGTMSYGASVGVLPFGDLVGFFLETRATSLFAGPRRTELFTYLGARAHFADYLEPALWAVLPIGSVADATGFQLGAELRFSYDIQDTISLSRSDRREVLGRNE